MCQGVKPNKIVIAFALSHSVAGDYEKSPWNFQGFKLTELTVSVDGIPALGNPLRLNFDPASGGVDTAEAFHWLIESSGKWLSDEGNQLTQDDMAGGYAVYAFDLDPSFQDRGYLSLIKQGVVRVNANFASPLSAPVTCIVYTEGPGYFEINQSRDVIVYQ